MNERSKKQLIAILLLVSCVISGWLLFITPAPENRQLRDFAEADSLYLNTLSDFNIAGTQISSRTIQVDSTFTRKTYRVSVPPEFSKTQLHAALQQQLTPYNISLPAEVIFPDKDMSIHFYYGDRVFQTVTLVTDEELTMQRSFARLIVAFDGRPPDYLLETITSMGEPMPIAVIMRPPLARPEWWDDFREEQDHTLYVWPQTEDGDNLLTDGGEQPADFLEPLRESAPNATLLHFFANDQAATATLQGSPLTYVNAREAFILDAEAGRSAFELSFRALVRRAREGGTPLGIIMGGEESLTWTQEELSTFKKGGLMITPPRKVDF